jgi:hypothetical protein
MGPAGDQRTQLALAGRRLRARPDHRAFAGVNELAEAGPAPERTADNLFGDRPAEAVIVAAGAIAANPIERQLHVDSCAGVEILADHSPGLDQIDIHAENAPRVAGFQNMGPAPPLLQGTGDFQPSPFVERGTILVTILQAGRSRISARP